MREGRDLRNQMCATGLASSMCNGAEISLEDGWADPANHDELTERYLRHIPLVAEAGHVNLICFSGNRRGMSDEDGLRHCAEGLSRILPVARDAGVVLQMELLNSRVNHPDYMCDRSAWGVALAGRPRRPRRCWTVAWTWRGLRGPPRRARNRGSSGERANGSSAR